MIIREVTNNDVDRIKDLLVELEEYILTIDKDNLFRLKEQYPEIYDQFVTLSETRRFYVKKSQSKAA